MSSKYTFFESDEADRLMDPSYYPIEIIEFLQQEHRLLTSMKDTIDLLIEVGCMDGRYLNWAVDHRKYYVGIDIILRHVLAGRQAIIERKLGQDSYRFIQGDAEEIAYLMETEDLQMNHPCCLVWFPFNVFGAISDCAKVLAGLRQCQIPFVISSYQITDYATSCRYNYYKNCGCKDIRVLRDEKGVGFQTSNGFQTIAYHPDYIQKLCSQSDLLVKAVTWSHINIAYVSDSVFSIVEKEFCQNRS